MKAEKNQRGFITVTHEKYTEPNTDERIIQESSVIGDYENSFQKPGSSFLWVGENHHLDREEIKELVERMEYWLKNGRLEVK